MTIYVKITSECNQHCVYCCAEGESTLNNEQIKKSISSGENIIITGGEPTIRKDVVKLIKQAKLNGSKEIEFQTNGTMLVYKDLARQLVDAGVTLFNVALPSHKKDISERITESNLFEERLQGIKNLLDIGANVRITMIINKLNADYMYDYAKFVDKNFPKIRILEFNFIKIMGRAKKVEWLVPKISEIETELKKAMKFNKENNINLLIDGIPLCHMQGYEEFNVDLIKFLTPGSQFFWKEENQKEKDSVCKKCSVNHLCGGFWKGYTKIHGKEEFKPLSINPEILKERIKRR